MMLQPMKTSTASKTNQLRRDMKLMQEMEQETAKILSPLFNDTVWLNRAYLLLKGQNLPESEGRFKTLVLILNGRIRHSLKLLFDVGTLHTAKIFSCILELDALIGEVIELPRTPSLDHFQSFAKGILFRNIGDTFLLLHNTEKESRIYEELAFISYSIAYDIFYKASPVSPLLAAIFVLETFILHTLLQHFSRIKISNLTSQLFGERLYTACNGVSTSRSKSFMISINSLPSTHETHGIEQNKVSRLIMLADKNDFLINLLWLLAYNSDIRNNVSFLDLFLKNIPAKISDGDDLQSFTLSSLSRIDAKVLLLGAAKWSELCTSHRQKYGTPSLNILPPLAFAQPSYMMLNFWNLLVSFINKEMRSNSNQLCSENGLIIAALEASRLRGEIPDVRIVDYIRKWLVANGNALGDTKGNWIKLYSRTFMDLINGAHYASQGVSTGDSFFPLLNDSDYDMLDDVEKWFSPQDLSTPESCFKSGPVLDESSQLKQVNVLSKSQAQSMNDASIKPKSFLQRIYTSAKTMLPSEFSNSITSACASKTDSIRALELVSKDYERRCKNEASTSLELSNLSTITKENKVEENLYAEIIKMQNGHAWDVCRLVQRINSLEETVKRYEGQYTTDLAMYTSKAYKQGYNDGYYSALQTSNVNLIESADQDVIPPTTQATNLLESQILKTLGVEHSHDPKECIGCASEEEQDRFLRILDSLADSRVI